MTLFVKAKVSSSGNHTKTICSSFALGLVFKRRLSLKKVLKHCSQAVVSSGKKQYIFGRNYIPSSMPELFRPSSSSDLMADAYFEKLRRSSLTFSSKYKHVNGKTV